MGGDAGRISGAAQGWLAFLGAFYCATSVTEWLVHRLLHAPRRWLPEPLRGWADSHMRHHSNCTSSTCYMQRCGTSDAGTWFGYGHCFAFALLILPPSVSLGAAFGAPARRCAAAAAALVWAVVGAHNYAHARNHHVALAALPFRPQWRWSGLQGWLPRPWPLPLLPWVPLWLCRRLGQHHLAHHASGGNYGVLLLGADWLLCTAAAWRPPPPPAAVHFPVVPTQAGVPGGYVVFTPAAGDARGLLVAVDGRELGSFGALRFRGGAAEAIELEGTAISGATLTAQLPLPQGRSRAAVLRRLIDLAESCGVAHNIARIADSGEVVAAG